MPKTEQSLTAADDPPGRVFFPQAQHQALWAQLPATADADAITAALPAYLALCRARTRHSKLFRQLGEPLRLDRDPLRLYALRQDGQTGSRRWFLAQYGPEAGQPAALQLLGVDAPDEPRFLPLAAPRPVDEDLPEPLWRERAWEVRTDWIDSQAHIRLQFAQGRLELTAEDGEIVLVRWNPAPTLALRWEQSERGDASRMLGRRRNPDLNHWQDEQLFAPVDPLTPLPLPQDDDGPLLVGRVAAVVNDPRRPDRVWFGNNRARVYGLDLADPTLLQRSPMLAGTVSDLLRISPGGTDPVRLLTLCSDGIGYLLEADGANPTRLRPRERCFHDVHLAQLFPLEQEALLGLDRDLRLWPLHLADPVAERDGLATFAARAWAALGLGRADHPLWSAPAKVPRGQRDALATLALDYCLEVCGAPCGGPADSIPIAGLNALLNWLLVPYRDGDAAAIDARAQLHGWLLERLWDWFDGRPVQANGSLPRSSPPPAATDLLFRVLEPPVDAPDWLWQRLLRDGDLLEPWIGTLAADVRDALRPRYRQWRREALAPAWQMRAVARSRSELWVESSLRLGSRPRHIRTVDAEAALVALIEYEGGLSLWRCPGTPDGDWCCHARLGHGTHWRGLPRALLAGDRLRAALGVEEGRFVLVATDRGELRLFRVDPKPDQPLSLVWQQDLDMDVRCGSLGSGKPPALLLGGADAAGYACIHRLWFHPEPNAQWRTTRQKDWTAPAPGGLLRMLGKARLADGRHWLWAADRFGGMLYRWPVIPTEPPRLDTARMETLLRGRKDLHTFALDRRGASDLAVCGGHDALAFAFDRRDGALRWVVGCNRSLTRAMHLGQGLHGRWLLCTDHADAMLVSEDGTPTGAVLGVGPVTAARLLEDPAAGNPGGQRLLLGDRGGRLSLLRFVSPRTKAAPAAPDRDADLPLRAALARYVQYPLRTNDPIDKAGLADLIDLARWHCPTLGQDHLCAQDVLFAIWQGLEAHGLDGNLVQPLAALLRGLANIVLVPVINPHRLARGLDTNGQALRTAWLDLFNAVWEDIARRNRDDNLCHQARVLSNLLMDRFVKASQARTIADVQPPVAGPAPHWPALAADEAALFGRIQACIWTPRPAQPDPCPENLGTDARILGLQLGQAARAWAEVTNRGKAPPDPACLNRWLHLLWGLWGQIDAPDFQARLRALLNQGAQVLPRPWDDWLRGLADDPAEGQAPEPLRGLDAPPDLRALAPGPPRATLQAVATALGEDPPWRHWVEELLGRLEALAGLQREAEPVLWQQRGELEAVRALVHDANDRRFSLATGHGLAVLWLPVVAERWEQRVEEAMAALEGEEPAPYVGVVLIGNGHWQHRNQVTLEFAVHNRYHADVLIQEVCVPYQLEAGPLPVVRAAREGLAPGARLWVRLTTLTPNRVAGEVTLHCLDLRLNRRFELNAPFEARRDLVRFFPGEWRPTGERLQDLLDQEAAFHWLDGHYWTREERRALHGQVQELFRLDLASRMLATLDAVPADGAPILAPDLLLDPANPARLVDSLNWTLHDPQSRVASRLGLSIWRHTHPLPGPVAKALDPLLPPPERVADLLGRLFGTPERVAALERGFRALPLGALGAWCTGDPVYAVLLERKELTEADALALYPDPLGVFDAGVWQALATLPDQDLAGWFSRPVADLQHRVVLGLFGLVPADPAALDAAARLLLERLGADPIEAPRPGRVWRLLTPLVVLEEAAARCHLLLGDLSAADLADLGPAADNLWLHIGPTRPSGLAGRLLSLDLGAAMRLMHMPRAVDLPAGPNPAVAELDRLIAAQAPPQPDLIFRDANGLGPPAQVARHFHGREAERRILLRTLAEADQDAARADAVLLVAGRRMGKTSLRQWLDLEVQRGSGTGGLPRPCLTLDCQNTPASKHRDDLLHWFYHDIKQRLNAWWEPHQGSLLLTQGWLNPGHREQREQAIAAFDAAWRRLREASGQAPLLLLDETRYLVAADIDLVVCAQLKAWVDTGLFVLVATALPHGQGERGSLHQLAHDPSTPLYNSFRQVLPLGAWTPDEAWGFLCTRLGYLGVTLPRHFRQRALRLTRGLPWLVHALGAQLCKALGQHERVISREVWLRAQGEALRTIATVLKEAVDAAAAANDRTANWGHKRPLPRQLQLSGGRLWDALCTAAGPGAAVGAPQDGLRWPEPRALYTRDLRATLGTGIGDERLRLALRDLIDPGILLGDTADRDRFTFMADLLPAWRTWRNDHV